MSLAFADGISIHHGDDDKILARFVFAFEDVQEDVEFGSGIIPGGLREAFGRYVHVSPGAWPITCNTCGDEDRENIHLHACSSEETRMLERVANDEDWLND
jgi:hypothetical protein